MSINLKICDQQCHECIKGYISKHSLKKGGKFAIPCRGIPKEYIPESIKATLGGDSDLAVAMLDPVLWAAKVLDWHCLDPDGENWKCKTENMTLGELPPYNEYQAKAGKSIFHRPYQAEMLRCTGRRKVFRIGRQAGKCLISGTSIQMFDGSVKLIENIQDGDQIVGLNNDYKLVSATAYKSFNGIKSTARLELMDGREIEGSLNHPFLVRKNLGRETTGKRRVILEDHWTELGELQPGDCVAVPRNIKELGCEDFEDDYKINLLGLMLADGNITSGNCRFSNQNYEILQDFRTSCFLFDCSVKQYPSDAEHDYHITGKGPGKKHPIREWFRDLGIWELGSHEKYIPDFIFKLKNEFIASLLNRMYGCDGWACVSQPNKPEIGYSTVSDKMANQIVGLLSRFGIYADIRHKITTLDGQKFHSRQIIISRRESIVRFVDSIGLLGKREKAEYVKQVALSKNSSYKTEVYEEDDILFIPVRSVELTGEKATWDLSVPEIKNFIANNIVSHNTETLCVAMLHQLYTHQNFKIVVIAPYQSQIDLIFARLIGLIQNNKSLFNSVSRKVKAPQYAIGLHNGSQVLGFTAGTKSGGNADAARGQSANMLVFDEADYLSAGDMDSALAIITNFPDATVWMSSTPTGRREKFYETCYNNLFKEFRYSSHVNPNWTEELDDLYHSQLTEDGYKHEVMAEFGEQEEGVYQAKYVEAAQSEFEYGQYPYSRNWIYMFGVDWNDQKIGTTIAITGYNPSSGYFYLVDKYIVSRGERTQLSACQKIAELNRLWNPAAIYVDKGFGTTQIEVLRDFGYKALKSFGANHPDAKLRNIVKGYDFGGNVEVRDLFTKQPIKKHAKPFLIENSVRRFETITFKYPGSDEKFTDQLLGYIVDRVTDAGRPVYVQQNESAGDHFLDAVNLSLVAFTLEKSQFGKPIYDNKVSFAGKIGAGFDSAEKSGSFNDQANNHKPKAGRSSLMQRADNIIMDDAPELPAANTGESNRPNIWKWPGFGHDAPKPQGRSRREAFEQAERRVLGPRGSRRKRPSRTKF